LPTKSTNIRFEPLRQPRFVFYGGKGGVGKTTCAAARAAADARGGARVLAVSTDPAHSLGDALGVRLTSTPRLIRPRLHAVELDAPRAFARWLTDHRQALGDIVEHGTWLDRDDVEALLGLSIPGIDELMGLLEIGRLSSARPDARLKGRAAYDLIVIDTAPTGHTLRLLAAPDTVAAVAGVFEAMQREHRLIREQLARVGRPEAADRLIDVLAEQARETGALLRDPARSSFHWILLPESLSLAESEDALAALDRADIAVAEVIVNRVTPDGPACPICDRRRAAERQVLGEIPRYLGRKRPIRIVPAALREPRGMAALARIGKELRADLAHLKMRPRYSSRGSAYSSRGPGTSPETIDAFRGGRLLLFGGKGGVGKTTCAAAAALALAGADPARRVLLLSTDPAHSLGDVFGVAVGDRPRAMPGAPANLRVRELDAPAALAARRGDLEAALNEIIAAFGAEGRASAGASGLMDLAPPGIDELLGVLGVVEAEKNYDLIILDTAPTGHALRLLEMPDAAREWVQMLMRVLLKYRALVRPGQLAAELLELSRSIHRLQTLLHDRHAARFIVVTRAAEMPRLETERLIARVRRLKLAAPAVVINAATLAPRSCPRCRATASAERLAISALTRACRRPRRECAIILTPLAAPPPRGVVALDRWSRAWIA